MLFPGTNLIFTVVSPLVALMEDQIREDSKLVITAMQTGVHNSLGIRLSLKTGTPSQLPPTDIGHSHLSAAGSPERFVVLYRNVELT